MRIGISNIAWDVHQDDRVAGLLREFGVDCVDVAPGKYFPELSSASDRGIAQVRKAWEARGMEIYGMQALLFGTQGLNMFGSAESQAHMLSHLAHACRIAQGLGARRLVFGSPKNRDRSHLAIEEATAAARDFFSWLGDIAEDRGVTICLEPNPEVYGANFMTCTATTAHIVRLVDHPHIAMQLDIGAAEINGEDLSQLVSRYARDIGHVHVSEPNLAEVGARGFDHAKTGATVAAALPGHVATIEMVTTPETRFQSIRTAVATAVRYYGGHQ